MGEPCVLLCQESIVCAVRFKFPVLGMPRESVSCSSSSSPAQSTPLPAIKHCNVCLSREHSDLRCLSFSASLVGGDNYSLHTRTDTWSLYDITGIGARYNMQLLYSEPITYCFYVLLAGTGCYFSQGFVFFISVNVHPNTSRQQTPLVCLHVPRAAL